MSWSTAESELLSIEEPAKILRVLEGKDVVIEDMSPAIIDRMSDKARAGVKLSKEVKAAIEQYEPKYFKKILQSRKSSSSKARPAMLYANNTDLKPNQRKKKKSSEAANNEDDLDNQESTASSKQAASMASRSKIPIARDHEMVGGRKSYSGRDSTKGAFDLAMERLRRSRKEGSRRLSGIRITARRL